MTDLDNQLVVVEPDTAFYDLIASACSKLNIPLQHFTSIAEIQSLKSSARAFLISGTLADGTGVDLIQWLRDNPDFAESTIAMISSGYVDIEDFQNLKEKLQVDFVINKPIETSALSTLIEILYSTEQARSTTQKNDPLAEVKKKYQLSIYKKLSSLDALIKKYTEESSEESLKSLKGTFHKLAGSAGSYGYMEVTNLCKEMEQIASKSLASDQEACQQLKNDLDSFFAKLKIAFQMKEHHNFSFTQSKNFQKAADTSDPLAELKASYLEKIGEKLEQIESSIANIQNEGSDENLEALKKVVHKIAGSAGSYGFPEVTRLCKAKENELLSLIGNSEKQQEKVSMIDSLPAFLELVKQAFQTEDSPKEAPLENIEKPKESSSTTNPGTLHEEYLEKIPKKLKTLQELTDKVIEAPERPHIESLKKYLHKIAGSAGSFGYMKVTLVAKRLEKELREILLNNSGDSVDNSLNEKVSSALQEITDGYQVPPTTQLPL